MRNPPFRKLEMAFGCASLTVPPLKHQKPCSAAPTLQRTAATASNSTWVCTLCRGKWRVYDKTISYSIEKWKKAAHQEYPKRYHQPKGGKEETMLWLCLPHKCPFAGLICGTGWGVDLNSAHLVSFPAVSPPRTTKLLSALSTKGLAGVQCVQWEAPNF